MKKFQGGLVFKAHRLVYHSTLGWRVIKKKTAPAHARQPSALDQIDDFRLTVSWLAEANSPLPDDTWLKFQEWVWSNPEG